MKTQKTEIAYVDNNKLPEYVFNMCNIEKGKQIDKWGIQAHTLTQWAAILGEEVGETNKAILEHIYGDKDHIEIIKELIQVATVALNMVATIDKAIRK
jgi:hypothetical protein